MKDQNLEDRLDEIRLSHNPEFVAACLLIVKGLKESKIDLGKVKKIKLGTLSNSEDGDERDS